MVAGGGFYVFDMHAATVAVFFQTVSCRSCMRHTAVTSRQRLRPLLVTALSLIVLSRVKMSLFPPGSIVLVALRLLLLLSQRACVPLQYFKWVWKQETVFSRCNPWPLPHHANALNDMLIIVVYFGAGRLRCWFYFLISPAGADMVKCKWCDIDKESGGATALRRKKNPGISAITQQWLAGYIVILLFFSNSVLTQGNTIFLFVHSVGLSFIQNKSTTWKTSVCTPPSGSVFCDICSVLFVFGSSLQAAVAAILSTAAVLVASRARRETHLSLTETQQEGS